MKKKSDATQKIKWQIQNNRAVVDLGKTLMVCYELLQYSHFHMLTAYIIIAYIFLNYFSLKIRLSDFVSLPVLN